MTHRRLTALLAHSLFVFACDDAQKPAYLDTSEQKLAEGRRVDSVSSQLALFSTRGCERLNEALTSDIVYSAGVLRLAAIEAAPASCPPANAACAGTYIDFIKPPPGETFGPTSAYELGSPYQGCGRKPNDSFYYPDTGCGCGQFLTADGATKCKTPCYRLGSHSCGTGQTVTSIPSCALPEELHLHKSLDGCITNCTNRWPCKPDEQRKCIGRSGRRGEQTCDEAPEACSTWEDCREYVVVKVQLNRINLQAASNSYSALYCSDLAAQITRNIEPAFTDFDAHEADQYPVLNYKAETVGERIDWGYVVRYPGWAQLYSQPRAVQIAWANYLAALKVHESGHVERFMKFVKGLPLTLSSVQTFGTDGAAAAVQAKFAEMIAAHESTQHDYDSATSHGASQGAVLKCPPLH